MKLLGDLLPLAGASMMSAAHLHQHDMSSSDATKQSGAQVVSSQTVLAQMCRWCALVQPSRAPMQRMADRVAGVSVLAVIGAAAVTFVAWGLWGPKLRWIFALINAVAVLIIACPCTLSLATSKQNLAFAFVYNALGIPLAAGVLYPFTGWLLSPMIAPIAMSLGSASMITNALRLRATK